MQFNILHLTFIITLFPGDVLKTTLLIRFTTNQYPEDYIPTVFDNYSFSMVVDGKQVTMGLWDTAGQEEYDRLRPLSYESTDAFVLIFDRYSINTYENIKSRWFPELQQHAGHVPIVLVGVTIESVDPTIPQLDLITSEQGKELKQTIKVTRLYIVVFFF